MAHPKQEAYDKLAGEFEVRVLEPSPPAVGPPAFTDDPVYDGEVADGRLLVSPMSNGDLTWHDLAADRPELGGWCAERWLGAYKPLEPLPASFGGTVATLHKVAEGVVAPARKPETEISLRYTRGGFGTPFFEAEGKDCQVRVEHGQLVRQRGIVEEREALPEVDEDSARVLGDFYGFACSILEELRHAESDADPARVRLWPEHFDIATELGSEQLGTRANYGASPGDEDHAEPYLYVGPWTAEVSGELWNATAFNGAELTYSELLEAPNQRRAAFDFMHQRLHALEQ
jgi:hypothetical protein